MLIGLVAAGCYDARAPEDAGRSLDAGRDAPVRDAPRDAYCVRVRELADGCRARWTHAWGVDGDITLTVPVVTALPASGVALALVTWGAVPLRVGSFTFDGRAVVGLDAAGTVSWGRENRTAGLTLDGSAVAWVSYDGNWWLERSDPATGETISRSPTVRDPNQLSTAACATCAPSFLLTAYWRDAFDLGPLGVRTGVDGLSLVAVSSAGPRWDATVPLPRESAAVGLALPPRTDATGGAVVGWNNGISDSVGYSLCPVPGGPCAAWADGIVVAYDADGLVRWTAAPGRSIDAIEVTSDGGAVAAEFTSLVRYAPDGTVRWGRGLNEFTAPIAVDEARSRVWAAISVPLGRVLEIGGVRVGDCPTGPGPWSRWPTLLVEFDLETGDVIRARLPVEDMMIQAIAVLPDGGVVISGDVEGASSIVACGETVTRDDAPGAPIEVVTLALD